MNKFKSTNMQFMNDFYYTSFSDDVVGVCPHTLMLATYELALVRMEAWLEAKKQLATFSDSYPYSSFAVRTSAEKAFRKQELLDKSVKLLRDRNYTRYYTRLLSLIKSKV